MARRHAGAAAAGHAEVCPLGPHRAGPAVSGPFDRAALGAMLNLWRLLRWCGGTTTAEPLLRILDIGYAWLALSVALLGLAMPPRARSAAAALGDHASRLNLCLVEVVCAKCRELAATRHIRAGRVDGRPSSAH
ncbi:MAG: NnrS family protein [Alphaproteobacteria bacterium]